MDYRKFLNQINQKLFQNIEKNSFLHQVPNDAYVGCSQSPFFDYSTNSSNENENNNTNNNNKTETKKQNNCWNNNDLFETIHVK